MRVSRCFFLVCGSTAILLGARSLPAAEMPLVAISRPVVREVTDFVDFTGRTEAVQSINVVPRVTGYLVRSLFQDGALVKKGDLLFEIDSRPYQAQTEEAMSKMKLNEAQLELAEKTYARFAAVAKAQLSTVGERELDQYKAAVDEAKARLEAQRTNLLVCRLNQDFTHVVSPIDGQAGRCQLSPGNLVAQDQTVLTTVVSLDPIYVYFDMDEATLLQIRRGVNAGRMKGSLRGPVAMALQDDEGYPHAGVVDFINNQVNPATGTISARGVFHNPSPPDGQPLMSPGMFARVRLPIGSPYQALLVVERAIGSDQGVKYVFVIDAQHKVEYRRVETGGLQDDGLRVVKSGLKEGDQVVVGGRQNIRPQMQVETQAIPMPVLAESEKGKK